MASRYLTGNFFRSGSYGQLSESRNFTTLDATGSKHYTIPSISLGSNDFEVELEFSGVETAAQAFVHGTLQSEDVINISVGGSTDVVAFSYVGTTLQPILGFSKSQLLDGKLHKLKLTYNSSSGLATFLLDGVVKDTETWALDGNQDIAEIGHRNTSGQFADGIIANVKITDAGTLKRFYKIDETWDGPSTVLVDSGSDGSNGTAVNITSSDSETFTKAGDDWLGAEVVVNGSFGTDTVWLTPDGWSISGGKASAISMTGIFYLRQNGILIVGKTYEVSFEVSDYVGTGTVGPSSASFAGMAVTANGTYTFIGVSLATFLRFTGRTQNDHSIDNVSSKRILEGA